MFVLMLTACSSLPPPSPAATLPANLATPCPGLPPLSDGTGATVLKWIVTTVQSYQDCQDRHRRLVEAWPKFGTTGY
jgi:hypothetical protein